MENGNGYGNSLPNDGGDGDGARGSPLNRAASFIQQKTGITQQDFLAPYPISRAVLPLLVGVVGAALAAVMFNELNTDINNYMFKEYVKIFEDVSGTSSWSSSLQGLYAAPVGGILIAISPIFAFLGIYLRTRALYIFFIVVAFVGVLVSVIGPIMSMEAVNVVGGPSEEQYFIWNRNRDDNGIDEPSSTQLDLMDFHIAMFRICCANKDFTDHQEPGYYGKCTGSIDDDCPEPKNEVARSVMPNRLLCTCYEDQELYDSFVEAIKTENVCEDLRSPTVDLGKVNIPVIDRPLADLIRNDFPDDPVNAAPFVGFHTGLEDFAEVNVSLDSRPDHGFGCGLGYVKGTMWMLEIWYQQNYPALMWTSVGIAIAAALLLGVISIMICIQSMDQAENAGIVDKPADFVDWRMFRTQDPEDDSKWDSSNPAHSQAQQVPSGVQVAPQQSQGSSMSQPSSAPQPQQNVQASASEVDPAAKSKMVKKLTAFYMRFDPEKDMSDVGGLAEWALLNGEDALNKKLMGKYGSDINTIYKEELTKKLTEFYSKHEPSKAKRDIEDLAKWGTENGEDELNSRLHAKFGTDLTSVVPPEESSIGVKVLSGDVDF